MFGVYVEGNDGRKKMALITQCPKGHNYIHYENWPPGDPRCPICSNEFKTESSKEYMNSLESRVKKAESKVKELDSALRLLLQATVDYEYGENSNDIQLIRARHKAHEALVELVI